MSWSFSCIGKPAAVAAAFQKYADDLSGQSRLEVDAALPHVKGILGENFVAEGCTYSQSLIDFEASGSGGTAQGKQVYRGCTVKIQPVYKTLV